jgi:protein phosphatase 4 regulatory subunit 3
LTVLDEDDNDTLLMHNITSDDIYRKQEGELTQYHFMFALFFFFLQISNTFSLLETIISWRDREAATDLALSFQEAAGCSYIW